MAIIMSQIPAGMAAESAAGPLLVPVFGRGRALGILPLSGPLNVLRIEDMAVFISGPCSCQVKEENPGFDLLLAAAWEENLSGRLSVADSLPVLQAPAAAVPEADALARLSERQDTGAADTQLAVAQEVPRSTTMLNVIIVLASLCLLVAVVSVWMRVRGTAT
jgi:hypothetical protein